MGLVLPDQTEVGSVDYTIKKANEPLTSGKMAVGADGVASVTVDGLEPGADYRTDLSAKRMVDLPCVGTTEFVVREGKIDPVNVVFQCDSVDDPYAPAPQPSSP
jgi:hypothetical protein